MFCERYDEKEDQTIQLNKPAFGSNQIVYVENLNNRHPKFIQLVDFGVFIIQILYQIINAP